MEQKPTHTSSITKSTRHNRVPLPNQVCKEELDNNWINWIIQPQRTIEPPPPLPLPLSKPLTPLHRTMTWQSLVPHIRSFTKIYGFAVWYVTPCIWDFYSPKKNQCDRLRQGFFVFLNNFNNLHKCALPLVQGAHCRWQHP